MNTSYKPHGYNSLSPYLICDHAQSLADLLKLIFDAEETRRFERTDGKIAHLELKIDDSILMICDSTENYSATKSMMHLYVPDVFSTFQKAMENGCEQIEAPINLHDDPDTRGSFYDTAGNYWAVSTPHK
ncbi:VOC family protein [Flavobacterium sp. WC2429]|uniref:VOC family protein n=2 Tax=unclassified Flavobacterium TaxID=196869 RepID=A0AB39WGD4_9FLAO